jgi:hypothetical protein
MMMSLLSLVMSTDAGFACVGDCPGGEQGPICWIWCAVNSRDFGRTGEDAIHTLSKELSLDPAEENKRKINVRQLDIDIQR